MHSSSSCSTACLNWQYWNCLWRLTQHVSNEIILECLLPYMLFLVNNSLPQVRAQALKILGHCLQLVRSVCPTVTPAYFPEYVLSSLSWLTQDEEVIVRIAYAKNIASLHCSRDGFEISGNGAIRLCQSREQWRWWLTYSVSGIIIFFKGTGCGWILYFYTELYWKGNY